MPENKKPLGAAGIAAAVAALVLGGGFYLSQTDAVKQVVVTPEKQVVVKEGFSGSKDPVIVTHKEFTGGGNKVVVVSPEKPETITGYSKVPFLIPQKAPVITPVAFPEVDVVVDGHKYTCTPE